MRRPTPRVTINLTGVAYHIYVTILKHANFGWMSKFVSEQLLEHYYKDTEKKVLEEVRKEKEAKANKLGKELEQIARRLKKLK